MDQLVLILHSQDGLARWGHTRGYPATSGWLREGWHRSKGCSRGSSTNGIKCRRIGNLLSRSYNFFNGEDARRRLLTERRSSAACVRSRPCRWDRIWVQGMNWLEELVVIGPLLEIYSCCSVRIDSPDNSQQVQLVGEVAMLPQERTEVHGIYRAAVVFVDGSERSERRVIILYLQLSL